VRTFNRAGHLVLQHKAWNKWRRLYASRRHSSHYIMYRVSRGRGERRRRKRKEKGRNVVFVCQLCAFFAMIYNVLLTNPLYSPSCSLSIHI
jgi:hypothetical protein